MFSKNTYSVFKQGLIDISSIRNGVPLIVSQPHFYGGDPNLIKSFGMKPSKEKHGTFVSRPIFILGLVL